MTYYVWKALWLKQLQMRKTQLNRCFKSTYLRRILLRVDSICISALRCLIFDQCSSSYIFIPLMWHIHLYARWILAHHWIKFEKKNYKKNEQETSRYHKAKSLRWILLSSTILTNYLLSRLYITNYQTPYMVSLTFKNEKQSSRSNLKHPKIHQIHKTTFFTFDKLMRWSVSRHIPASTRWLDHDHWNPKHWKRPTGVVKPTDAHLIQRPRWSHDFEKNTQRVVGTRNERVLQSAENREKEKRERVCVCNSLGF